jgi:hypothetical protein
MISIFELIQKFRKNLIPNYHLFILFIYLLSIKSIGLRDLFIFEFNSL